MPSAASQKTSSPPISPGLANGRKATTRITCERQVAGAIETSWRQRVITTITANASAARNARPSPARLPSPGAPSITRDARQRQRHREDGAPRDRLAERHPGEQRGEHGRDGQDEQDARHARVVERGDEAARGGRDAHRHGDAREPDRPERLQHPAALDDRDVGQQRDAREHRPAEDLRRRVERELALQDAGGRPRDRGERDIDLPAPLAPRRLDASRRHSASAVARARAISSRPAGPRARQATTPSGRTSVAPPADSP